MKNAHGKIKTDEIKLIWLIVGELATWIGASFIWPLTSVYLNKQLHISLSIIGVVLFCNCAGNILGSIISGRLYDKYNPYPLMLWGLGLDAAVLFLMAAFHGWPEYWVWLTLTGFLGGWNGTLINSVATSLKKYPSRYVFNVLYFSQNLGVVTGTLIVGYLYDFSITLLFVIAALLFVIAFINAVFNYKPIIAFHKERMAKHKKGEKHKAEPMPKRNFIMTMVFFTTLGVTWLMYMNWESNLSVYMVSLGIPFHLYSLLWTLNAGVIVIMQGILARFPNIFKNLFHQIIFGICMFSLSFITLVFAKDFAHFALSMFILTLGESTAFPAIPAYVNDLSPLTSKGKYQGANMVASGIGRAFGPLFGGLIIDHAGYIPFFWVAAIVIALMIVVMIPTYMKVHKELTIYK
ncbi:MAG: MFS transporter [Lactobacillus amylovorus]|uniref:MFS transporter n=2 Tax=Lactobacillus amylovorus TaxID=1604 RepID=A0A413DIW9_LACAM|nr:MULTISPECIES: MFS transporter [Lactobacillus]CDA26373.1 multidrug resistance protein [Lactobacillus amylovorus CAG:719]AUX15209.1 MFS transporter [Lactobacillus amylovorus]MCT3596048.1 MFS transporter [Lactobacillus amylovorus]MDB6220795.1 MFS transporter [Lactobacillus amylovorus]MDB6225042.1 MFS transporter [Lactobacillus amylovorus]